MLLARGFPAALACCETGSLAGSRLVVGDGRGRRRPEAGVAGEREAHVFESGKRGGSMAEGSRAGGGLKRSG